VTRKELETLTAAVGHLREGDHLMCMAHLRRLQIDAEFEFALEERYWSDYEAISNSLEQAA
jgi:hypothetical protein